MDFAVPYAQAQSNDFQLEVKIALSRAFSLYAPMQIDFDDLVVTPGVYDSNETSVYNDTSSLHEFPGQQVMGYNKDYVVRIVYISLPRQSQGQTVIRITFIILYKNRPLKQQKSLNILQPILKDRLRSFFSVDVIGRPGVQDGSGDSEGVPILPLVIGSVCGFLVVIVLLCLACWKCRTKQLSVKSHIVHVQYSALFSSLMLF
jgi:hypothetical protein